jgi:hypothetical protein
MSRRFHKLLVPFILLPLVTGGLVTFVVLVDQNDETDVISNVPFSFPEFSIRDANVHAATVVVAAIVTSLSAIIAVVIFSFLVPLYEAILSEQAAPRIRNKSPPTLHLSSFA